MFEKYPDVVTVEQLQTMLHKGRNKVYQLLKTGMIKSKKMGRNYIIPKVYVIDYLLSNYENEK